MAIVGASPAYSLKIDRAKLEGTLSKVTQSTDIRQWERHLKFEWHDLADGKSGSRPKPLQDVVALLIESSEKRYVQVAWTCHSNSNKSTETRDGHLDRGIYLKHAYSVLVVLANVAHSGRNFVLLRNPHGHTEWTGP